MDAAALPEELPPSADYAGVPLGTTIPPEPPPADAYAQAVPPGQSVAPAQPPQGMPAIPGMPPVDMAQLSQQLAAVQRNKMAANERVAQDMERTLRQDQARVAEAYKQTGISPGDMQPWDANAAREQFRYDPVEVFGSLGSVFAVIASAFTNAPMTNSMAGAAAAMTAVKDGKKEDFDRSYKAWQDNFKLALDRHKIQQQHYKDSITLMDTNMSAGTARMRVNAARFGDQQALFLLENGMNKELLDLVEKRQSIGLKLAETLPKLAIENEKVSDLMARTNGIPKGTPEYNRAVQEWQQDWVGRKYDEDQDFSRRFWDANPEATSDQFAEAFGDFKKKTIRGRIPPGKEAEIERRASELQQTGMSRTQAYDTALREVTAAGAVNTRGRADQATIDARAAELRQADPALSPVDAQLKARREVNFASAAPSGNRLDDMQRSIDRIGHLEFVIDKVEDLLKKHSAITGLGGTILRPTEIVGNVFGSNDTDRKQFERFVAELQELAPRALTDSNGRPLASDVGKINTIIAGMRLGDTAANTARAYNELRQMLLKMKGDIQKRQSPGTSPAAPPAASGAPASTGSATPWANDPVAQ